MSKNFGKKNDELANCQKIAAYLIRNLGLRISSTTLRKVLANHAEYSSLSSLSDSFDEWNIENMAVNISSEQLREIPLPVIAHLKTGNEMYFVVITNILDEAVEYFDSSLGDVKESIDIFCSKWTGNALLISAGEKAGEENYEQNRKLEIFQQVSLSVVLGLLAVLLILPLSVFNWQFASIYILKVIGGVLACLLLHKQFEGGSVAVDVFCKLGSKVDCDSVINSPGSKIFGQIHLSEIGVWYFAGGLLSISIGSLSSLPVITPLFVIAVLPLPFSMLAFYYQGWIIKKWCPLCLAVLTVVWLEFAVHLSYNSLTSVATSSWLIVFLSFSLPLIGWLSVRQRFLDSFKVPKLERSLSRFVKSERIFQKLLNDQRPFEPGYFFYEIQEGADEVPLVITVVSNPDCGPCAQAHAVIEDLVSRFGDRLKIVFRFAINSKNPQSLSYEMLRHLFAIRMNGKNKDVHQALSSWYLGNGRGDLLKWKKENPVLEFPDPAILHAVITEHAEWCTKVGITATPTILINGQSLPEEFSVSDLKYHVRKLLENIAEHV